MRHIKDLIIPCMLILGILFGPNFYIVGQSLRVITSSIGLLLLWLRRSMVKTNVVFQYYLLYVFIYVVVAYFNGDSSNVYFTKGLLNWHLPCLLLFLLVPTYLNTKKNLKYFCYVISFVFLVDVVLSIGQFFNNPVAWNIGNTINAHAAESSEYFMERNDVSEGFLGLSIISGMCASVVDNGYFLAVFYPLLLVMWYENNSFIKRTPVLIFMVLSFFASFAIQQRMGFFLVSLFLIFQALKVSSGGMRFIVICLVLFFFIGFDYIAGNIDLGRIAEVSDEERTDGYLRSIDLIVHDSQMFTIGGEVYYRRFFDHTPHNTLIGAWVYTGFVGFSVFMLLLFNVVKQILPSVLLKLSKENIVQYSLAISCLLFIVYSLTHSTGIHNGKGLYFWLSYGLFYKGLCFNNKTIV